MLNHLGGEALAETKLAKYWGTACLRQVLLALGILFIFMVAFVGLIALSLELPIPQSQRPVLIFGGLMCVIFVLVLAVIVWGMLSLRRRARWLDAVFSPLGLPGRSYLWNGRQYHGLLQSRQVDAYFYRGPNLDIYLASPIRTRLGIGSKGCISQAASRVAAQPTLTIPDPGLEQFAITALDQQWGRELLGDPAARTAILRLTSSQSGFEFRSLLFQPEAIQLQINHLDLASVTPQALRSWVDDLISLAGIAESLPPPLVQAQATPLERKSRLDRSSFSVRMFGITCAVIAFMLIFLFIVLFSLIDLQVR